MSPAPEMVRAPKGAPVSGEGKPRPYWSQNDTVTVNHTATGFPEVPLAGS